MLVLNLYDCFLFCSSFSSLPDRPSSCFVFLPFGFQMSLSSPVRLTLSPTWSHSKVSTLPPLLVKPGLDRFVTVRDWLTRDGCLLSICVRLSSLTDFDSSGNPDCNLSMRRCGRTFNSLSNCGLTSFPVD